MGNFKLKQTKVNQSNSKLVTSRTETNKVDSKFVLVDVSKEELNKRRVPIYPYLVM